MVYYKNRDTTRSKSQTSTISNVFQMVYINNQYTEWITRLFLLKQSNKDNLLKHLYSETSFIRTCSFPRKFPDKRGFRIYET